MKELNCDLHIIGGALTGLLTAYCASSLNLKIIISEKKNIRLSNKSSITDTRTTAISEGSKIFLNSQGLWKKIKSFAEPIKNIKVVDASAKSNIDFYNPVPKSNLGYIVKNSKLINLLINELKKKNNVYFLKSEKINSISQKNKNIISFSENKKIKSKLIIAADGKNSAVRHILGTNIFKKKYNEKALVINFFHERSHKNTAYEFFLNLDHLLFCQCKRQKTNIKVL